jgi:hypothetical protein
VVGRKDGLVLACRPLDAAPLPQGISGAIRQEFRLPVLALPEGLHHPALEIDVRSSEAVETVAIIVGMLEDLCATPARVRAHHDEGVVATLDQCVAPLSTT